MKISNERAEVALKHCKRMRFQINPAYSDAGDWWDKLAPAWRGVVIHAAGVSSGKDVFKSYLCNCNWRELFARLEYRDMILLRNSIRQSRLIFAAFGTLRDSDFSVRTANRQINESVRKNGDVSADSRTMKLLESKARLLQQQGNH